MNLIPIFSTAILIATIASVLLALASYFAYKLREKRRPNRNFDPKEIEDAAFFHRYEPPTDVRRTGTDG